jgi:hypothetical protein
MGKDKNAKTKAKAEKAKDKKVKVKKSKTYAKLYPKLGAAICKVETEIKTRNISTHILNLKTIINEKYDCCKSFADAIDGWFPEPPEDLTVSTDNLEIQYKNSKIIHKNLDANFKQCQDLLSRIEQMKPTEANKNKINKNVQRLVEMIGPIASVVGHIASITNIESKNWTDTKTKWAAVYSLGKESIKMPELTAIRTAEIEYIKSANQTNELLEKSLKQTSDADFLKLYNAAMDPSDKMIAAGTDLDSNINALENNQNELHTKTAALKKHVECWKEPRQY